MSSTSHFSSSNRSLNSNTPPSPPRNMRSLDDLYKVTNPIDNDVTLYCRLATCDLIVLEKAIKNAK